MLCVCVYVEINHSRYWLHLHTGGECNDLHAKFETATLKGSANFKEGGFDWGKYIKGDYVRGGLKDRGDYSIGKSL